MGPGVSSASSTRNRTRWRDRSCASSTRPPRTWSSPTVRSRRSRSSRHGAGASTTRSRRCSRPTRAARFPPSTMDPIGLDDVLGRERYGGERDVIRHRLIEHKRARRVAVGDRLSFVFEDRATIWYQVQEMLWVENITDLDAIREELAVYNQLLPGPAELSATLLIEIEDQSRMRPELTRLISIDEHVMLEVAGERVRGRF